MAKLSKFFRVAVAGDTCDGREISESDIQQMADTFDPRVYGCRVNLEHFRGLFPDGDFRRLGDVTALKAERIDDDSALNGRLALFSQISPTDDLIAMTGKRQKIYTSIEIQPNFANSGKSYLVGLAVTDDPASLGTEMLEFSRKAEHSPLANRKKDPANLFSVATEVELSFEDVTEPVPSVRALIKDMFSKKKKNDDAQFADVHEAITLIAEQVQHGGEATATQLASLEKKFSERLDALEQETASGRNEVNSLTRQLEQTDGNFNRRPLASGGNGKTSPETDC